MMVFKKNCSGQTTGWPCFILILFSIGLKAQQADPSDDLLHQARYQAFELHNYPGAIEKCKQAISHSPRDPDLRVFLGRLYTWSHFPDSARQVFGKALEDHPGYEDACIAYADLESWNDSSARALSICMNGLQFHPRSVPLLRRRASLLADLHRYREARAAADSLLAADPGNADVRSLQARIRDYAAGNKIGVSYDYVYFDRQYNDPWQLASIEYSHQTAIGTVIGRVNYANRFRSNGLQFEADAYPHLSRIFYSYLNVGYSADQSIFPGYRAGASLYANLPHAFEADGGFRYLYFGSNTWLYTFSIGKYYKSFWFNARTYLVPGSSGTSQSLTLTGRYYTGGADDYYSLAAGTGISPDDRSNNLQLADPYKLKTQKLDAGWRHTIGRLNIVYADVQWLYQEYLPKTYGNQVDIGIGYQRRF